MGIAASAPLLGYPGLTDPAGWNRVVTEAFRSVCGPDVTGTSGDNIVEWIREGFGVNLEITNSIENSSVEARAS